MPESGVGSQEASVIPILEARGLEKVFPARSGGKITALAGLELSVPAGRVTVIGGRSGAGKSTLLSLLAGLDRPTAGSVLFFGQALERLDNSELARLRREKIGMIFQNFQLLPSWTAAENVEAVLMHSGLSHSERMSRVEAILKELGLAERLGNLPGELSVGQQQRVALARTLVNDPVLILADEPTGNVDPQTAEEMLDLLMARVRGRGTTLVVATHGAFPGGLADHSWWLADGRLQPGGPAHPPTRS